MALASFDLQPNENRKKTSVSSKLGKLIGGVSPCKSFIFSLTFAPLTSNTLQPFLSLALMESCIPCKSLSHQGPEGCCSGPGSKVGNWETGCKSEWHFVLCPVFHLFLSLPCQRWCVYLTIIPTCSDATHGNHLSPWYFLRQKYTCKHTVVFASYSPGFHTSSSRACK